MTTNMVELIPSLKTNYILLDDAKENELCERMESKINAANAATFYSISHYFTESRLSEVSLSIIERCFPLVAESRSFAELRFKHLVKIISIYINN